MNNEGTSTASTSDFKIKNIKIDVTKNNILYIDETIKKNIETRSAIDIQDIKRYEWIYHHGLTIDKEQAQIYISALKEKIKNNFYKFHLTNYILLTDDILTEYKKIIKKTKQGQSFIYKKSSLDLLLQKKKKKLIAEYYKIASKYVELTGDILSTMQVCKKCLSQEFEKISNQEFGGGDVYVCKNCAILIDQFDVGISYKDTERVKINSSFEYDPESHFDAAIIRLEGKQNKDIPDKILKVLQDDIDKYTGNDPTIKIKKKHVYTFLEKHRFSDYYKDINLIFYKLTGEPLPEISHIRLELKDMHTQYLSVENDEEDTNERNVNFKLYKFLQLLDYECSREDFFFLKNIENEKKTYQKYRNKIEALQKTYPNTMTSNGKLRWRYISSRFDN